MTNLLLWCTQSGQTVTDSDWQLQSVPNDSRGLYQPTHQHATTLLSTSVRWDTDGAFSIVDPSTLKMFAWVTQRLHIFWINVRWERQNWTSEDFDLMINAYQTSFSVEINLDEWKTINGTSLKHWTEMTHSTRSVRVAFTCWGGWDLLVRESHCWGSFTSLWWHFCLARALLYPITSMESRGSHRLSAVMDNTFHIRLWRP